MAYIRQRITIATIKRPAEKNLNRELLWLGTSLGLFSLRDKDKSCYRVFIELLRSAKKNEPLTSDELGARLNLSRGTIIHHINRLIEAGIVIHEGTRYLLRVDNLSTLISEMEKDFKRVFEDLKEIAGDIDEKLGL
tara:strand:- start:1338 stop:1745 length:408 start_codon:yes stop_codon:yes gene_type:complete